MFDRIAIQSWISLMHGEAGDGDGDHHGQRSHDAENFELRVAEEPQVFGQVDVAEEIADDVADSADDHGPCVGGFLLVRRRTVDDECSDTGLNDVD